MNQVQARRWSGLCQAFVAVAMFGILGCTRGFYQRLGFTEEARLTDFYGPGDGKVIYVKALAPFPPPQCHPSESRDPEPNTPK